MKESKSEGEQAIILRTSYMRVCMYVFIRRRAIQSMRVDKSYIEYIFYRNRSGNTQWMDARIAPFLIRSVPITGCCNHTVYNGRAVIHRPTDCVRRPDRLLLTEWMTGKRRVSRGLGLSITGIGMLLADIDRRSSARRGVANRRLTALPSMLRASRNRPGLIARSR